MAAGFVGDGAFAVIGADLEKPVVGCRCGLEFGNDRQFASHGVLLCAFKVSGHNAGAIVTIAEFFGNWQDWEDRHGRDQPKRLAPKEQPPRKLSG
ncbi:hypothetical protein GCM10007872_25120 [Gluconobacter sphaericus NBRC 12467]|uniref:Uncharacterized protein n=1 Tax=Gluconobacter sphaericus NBRC 12467 TaxID=1307951 RepID=A0AA37SKZ6_9PROT|nr:hypothetical protein AA12467_2250 [Gluconobacter sphaericus NBRC 12467]GEB43424.1 hypothetical protein GSP01_22060 [Gluconobacter sphaericus NBRC 12467]GLQ85602.1 hypothetical protein GCM10007872_25120 [Gluconobacter sphaericus NBRC 12467]